VALGTLLAWSTLAAGAPPIKLRATVPAAPPPKIMPLGQVRAGMVGEALTVFQGTKPEPFKIRVIDVMRNFLPKQDIILIRAEDPRLEHAGIVAGMSGSPVYIDGKLVGAIAYGWSFSKEPIGGVTPIEAMLAERARPRRRTPGDPLVNLEVGPDGARRITVAEGGPGPARAEEDDQAEREGEAATAHGPFLACPVRSCHPGDTRASKTAL